MILNPGPIVGLETAQGHSAGAWQPARHSSPRPKGGPAGRSTRSGARTGWSLRTGPLQWRDRRRPARRQGVEAPAGVAQARKGGNVGKGGTGGDTPRRWCNGGVAEASWDSSVPGSAVNCGCQRRWWLVPGALVNRGEVRNGGNLGGNTQGSGAHREAEVATMAAPNQ
jgi:hypothetical protein